MLQAWLDGSTDFRAFCLAGYIAPVSEWGAFSNEWQEVLDYNVAPHEPTRNFKIGELNLKNDVDLKRSEMFYRVIEKRAEVAISISVNTEDLKRAIDGFKFPKNVKHSVDLKNPYYWGFSGLIALVLRARTPEFGSLLNEPIDIFLDKQQEQTRCMQGWEELVKNYPKELPPFWGGPPTFRDDETFKPLQAADMYAYWVRKWHSEGNGLQKMHDMPLPWPVHKMIPRLYMRFQEPYITEQLQGMFNG